MTYKELLDIVNELEELYVNLHKQYKTSLRDYNYASNRRSITAFIELGSYPEKAAKALKEVEKVQKNVENEISEMLNLVEQIAYAREQLITKCETIHKLFKVLFGYKNIEPTITEQMSLFKYNWKDDIPADVLNAIDDFEAEPSNLKQTNLLWQVSHLTTACIRQNKNANFNPADFSTYSYEDFNNKRKEISAQICNYAILKARIEDLLEKFDKFSKLTLF